MKKYAIISQDNFEVQKMSSYWHDLEMENFYTLIADELLPLSINLISEKIDVNRDLQSLIEYELGVLFISPSELDSLYQKIIESNRTY